jgi:hypothetical protein
LTKAAAGLLLFLLAQNLAASDLRGASWLMSREQVRSVERGAPLSATDKNGSQQLVYKIFQDGKAGLLTYFFENNRLVSASYSFRNDQERALYETVRRTLAGQFGPPSLDSDSMVGWRLARTEIALTSLPDQTCYLVYWEKDYFAKINGLASKENQSN